MKPTDNVAGGLFAYGFSIVLLDARDTSTVTEIGKQPARIN
jgi:hypothetical protein